MTDYHFLKITDDTTQFYVTTTREKFIEGDAPLFAGHELRKILDDECTWYSIRWRNPEPVGDGKDVLAIEGVGPTRIAHILVAYLQGKDWKGML